MSAYHGEDIRTIISWEPYELNIEIDRLASSGKMNPSLLKCLLSACSIMCVSDCLLD